MKNFLFAAAILVSFQAYSQKLYTPRNIKNAIEKGTRTENGNPGKNYWQNSGNYDMKLSLNPETKIISGAETIEYFNNSPDSLKTAVIRFVNNVHKPTSARASDSSKDFLDNGLTIKSFKVNGESYDVKSENWGTVGNVKLKNPMLPKSKTTFEIVWEYPLSKESGREGQINETTFYAAYSYPRISVYDDYNGWDRIPHTGRNEFYNDFNNYNVAISVPKNYVVYATGVMQNPQEVLQTNALNNFKKSLVSTDIIHIAKEGEIAAGKITAQNDQNTFKFKADDITDFCWAASSSYVWDASSVQLDSKKVSVQSAYQSGAKDFEHYVEWEQYNIAWFSKNWPGVEYPFPTMTSFQGFADMEYPMMVNDSTMPDNLEVSRLVVDHEIAHTYFPFYMGINEKRYAYMDEGWATTFEYLIGTAEHGKEYADKFYKDFRVKRWIFDPSSDEDQPVISESTQVSGAGYGNNSYVKASLSYLALKDYLGDDLFKKALHHYMETWHGKHPIPWDYFYSMEAGSGKDLTWFFNNWFFSNNYIDLKLSSAKMNGKNLSLNIENLGGFAIPFDVITEYSDGTKSTKHFTPEVWKANEKDFKTNISSAKKVKSVTIDNGIYMDYKPNDNSVNL